MVTRLAVLLICFFALLSSKIVNGAASTWPAPIPLFHKSPYFNAWIDASSNVSNSPAHRWPQFFHRRDLGWLISIRVDNVSYMLQGSDADNTTAGNTVSTYITPTQTRFTIAVGPVIVNLTYLTPMELQDWALHSLPFVYAAFDIISSDGSPHAIQLYTETAFHFLSSNDTNAVNWNTSLTPKSIYHIARQRILPTLTENNDMSEDGSQIFAYTATPGVSVTWQTGSAALSRSNFSLNGRLQNRHESNFGAISRWQVLAYALDLGNIMQTSNTLVFGLGLIRDPVVSYPTAEATKNLSHLWYSRWGSIESMVDDFLTSYASASSRANALDDNVQRSASVFANKLNMSTSSASKLVDLHILSLRQIVGSLEFTTSRKARRLDMDDVRVFMKDVGYSRRINPVEILYASFPAFLFLNTTLAGKLLEPLLEFQASSLYSNDYAAPDLGSEWPTIGGNVTDQSLLAIDNCGAMLIMALAHAQKSGNGALLSKYYSLLQKWADYLVQSTKQPDSFMSSDGLYSSNVNLALKGIMGLYAMGTINKILEVKGADASKTSYYLDTANAYAKEWLNQAISSDHVISSYGSNSTWAMVYNLFAPRLLGATIIPNQIYEIQASWYTNRSRSAATFGFPFDSTQSLAKAHWTLLAAGSVFNTSSPGGRDALISVVHSRSFWKSGMNPNPATYSPIDGTQPRGAASPAMGAIYSFLALNLRDLPITPPNGAPSSRDSSSSTRNVGAIVGATLGSLGGLILIAAIVFFLRRRRSPKSAYIDDHLEELHWMQGATTVTPLFTNEIRSSVHEQDWPYFVQNSSANTPPMIPQTQGTNKFPLVLSPDSAHPAANSSNVAWRSNPALVISRDGGTTPVDDGNLRQEVEQLRRVVETLSEQVQQQPQVVYRQGRSSLPDEPPPVYN